MPDEAKKLDAFRKLCESHDLTFSYSDDSRAYRAGQAEYDVIRLRADEIPRAEVVRIWNEVVSTKLSDPTGYLWGK